jgi:hypothetical protein
MGTLGLEAVLVSDVGDGVDDAIRTGVGVLATDLNGLILRASVLQLGFFLLLDAIGGLKSVGKFPN